MRRRDLLALAGGAAAAGSWVARAQDPTRARRIVMLIGSAESDPDLQARVAAFRQALGELTGTERPNLRLDVYWGAGDPDRARSLAAALPSLSPDIVVANGTPALAALRETTRDVPIVFVVVADPVGAGFVESLARPGGNITGFSTFEPEIGGKWVEALREMSPGIRRVAGILDPDFRGFAGVWRASEIAAARLGIVPTTITVRTAADDIETALARFAQAPGGALIVLPTAINSIARLRIIALAARHRLPAIYPFRQYMADGGLMYYGFDSLDIFRRSASYVARILAGERPADLPVQAPTRFELVVNLATARALGIEVPASLLARADEVIE